MLYSGTDPESYITEHTLVYEYSSCDCQLLYRAASKEFSSTVRFSHFARLVQRNYFTEMCG